MPDATTQRFRRAQIYKLGALGRSGVPARTGWRAWPAEQGDSWTAAWRELGARVAGPLLDPVLSTMDQWDTGALLLEHAVIPPYLYALFSLKPNRNRDVADVIRGVVVEEMLHMALVGNILNAVGGTPVIGRPGTVPTYPNRLPAPVLPDLPVRQRRCSAQHVRDVVMAIEQPEHPTVNGRKSTGPVIDRSRVAVDRNGRLTASDATEMKACSPR